MATNGNQSDETRADVQLSPAILGEQTLAVDLARADMDTAIATAHRFPRILDTVIKKIETMACYNEAAAENCIYSLPRGGKPIIGASIGFANVVAQAWGNCTDGARIVYIDRKEKVVVAEGGFHDLETNRKTVLPVQRRIVDKQGRLFNDDMIMVTGMAAASIARRNAILNAVPRAIWFPIYERAFQIVRGDVETFAERKERALKAFAQFGVKPEQVFMALGLKGEADLTLEHIAPMRGMYSALRDGSTTVEEMFDPRRMAGAGFEKVSNPLGDEVQPAETVDKETGEIKAAAPKWKKQRGRPAVSKAPEQPPQMSDNGKAAAEATIANAQAENASLDAQLKAINAANESASTQKALSRPRNAAEYRAHMETWLAASKTVEDVENHWRDDRTLRGDCSVIEDDFNTVKGMKDQRIADLQPGQINADD